VGSDEDTIRSPDDPQRQTSEGQVQHSGEGLDGLGPERSAAREMSECFKGAPRHRLRVYMYELPRKFNFGLFVRRMSNASGADGGCGGREALGAGPGEEGALPPKWPWAGATHPTAKQHSMEYFIVADLLLPHAVRAALLPPAPLLLLGTAPSLLVRRQQQPPPPPPSPLPSPPSPSPSPRLTGLATSGVSSVSLSPSPCLPLVPCLWQMRSPNVTATRVLNPEEADVFLVPVFASLLVNIYRRHQYPLFCTPRGERHCCGPAVLDTVLMQQRTDGPSPWHAGVPSTLARADWVVGAGGAGSPASPCPPHVCLKCASCPACVVGGGGGGWVQEELAEFLSASPWWKRSGGRDHVIPLHHPCALDSVRDWMSGAMFIVVDFAR